MISMFKHAITMEDKPDSREVREDWVRKPYSWDSVELETCNVIQE